MVILCTCGHGRGARDSETQDFFAIYLSKDLLIIQLSGKVRVPVEWHPTRKSPDQGSFY